VHTLVHGQDGGFVGIVQLIFTQDDLIEHRVVVTGRDAGVAHSLHFVGIQLSHTLTRDDADLHVAS
jgi:hypothetical protein